MIRLTRSRRRLAALASTALAAGTLAVLPGVAGLTSASAAPVTTGMTCQISGSFPQTLAASTLATTLTAPTAASADDDFDATLAYTLTLTDAAFGPIDNIAGKVDFVLDVGGEESSVSVPFTTWTSGAPAFSGSGTVTLNTPNNVDLQDIKVVSAALNSTAHVNAGPPGGVTTPFAVPCTTNAGATTKIGTVATTKSIAYDCVMTQPGGATTHIASTLKLQADFPDAITAGETYESNVTATLDMTPTYLGPVTFNGTIDLPISLGGTTTTVAFPITANTPGGSGGAPPHPVFTGPAKSLSVVTGPAATSTDSPITLGDITANFTGSVGGATQPSRFPCTLVGGGTTTLNSTDVEAAPAGVKYTCTYLDWTFPAYVTTTATLPAAVNEDTAFNPAVATSLTWGRFWATSSRNILASYTDGTAALVTSTNGKAGAGSLTFSSTPVPATGAMTWTAAGTYGAVDTANPGQAALAVGNFTIKLKTTNKFVPVATPAEIPCTVGAAQALGTVKINDVVEQQPAPTVTAIKVAGLVKITGTPKVGKKLTAVPGKAAGATVKYQWLSNGKVIKKATGKTLKLTKSLKGKKISVKATYAKTGFKSVTQTSKAVKVKK